MKPAKKTKARATRKSQLTPEQLGKRTQKDADKGKSTYPALLGLDESRAEAEHHMNFALNALKPLGSSAVALKSLGQFVVQRQK